MSTLMHMVRPPSCLIVQNDLAYLITCLSKQKFFFQTDFCGILNCKTFHVVIPVTDDNIINFLFSINRKQFNVRKKP
jgi:hypothetical protein